MAAATGLRVLPAAILVALGLSGQLYVSASQPDHQVLIPIINSNLDLVSPFSAAPPKGFADVRFNDAGWTPAAGSPCADPSWTLPQGAALWTWASSCTGSANNLAMRRSFTIPARSVLSGRLWLAIHGRGDAYVNGHHVAQSIGQPVLVDITAQLKPNGAKNVLAILGSPAKDDTGLGFAYNLQLFLSGNAVAAYSKAHHVPAPVRPTPQPTAVAAVSTLAPVPVLTPGTGACSTNPPPGLIPVFTGQVADKATSTGWVRSISTQAVYVVTRQINIDSIQAPTDLPTIQVGSDVFRATAMISDDATGLQVLALPPTVKLSTLPIGQPRNENQGQTVAVTAFSRTLNCMTLYPAHILQYISRPDGSHDAQLDTIPFQDGADGGVAFDKANNFLGTILFNQAVVDAQGRVTALILPATTTLLTVDAMINVLNKTQPAATGQHVLEVVVNPDGTQRLQRTDGTNAAPTPAAGGAASPTPPPAATAAVSSPTLAPPTATTVVTPAPSGTP